VWRHSLLTSIVCPLCEARFRFDLRQWFSLTIPVLVVLGALVLVMEFSSSIESTVARWTIIVLASLALLLARNLFLGGVASKLKFVQLIQ
jgi:hypothetical protein